MTLSKSGCLGLSRQFTSSGVTALGTASTTDEARATHVSPNAARSGGAGDCRQPSGRLEGVMASTTVSGITSCGNRPRQRHERNENGDLQHLLVGVRPREWPETSLGVTIDARGWAAFFRRSSRRPQALRRATGSRTATCSRRSRLASDAGPTPDEALVDQRTWMTLPRTSCCRSIPYGRPTIRADRDHAVAAGDCSECFG